MTMTNLDSMDFAAIDVGSNAARLLIKHADIDLDGNVTLRKMLFLRIPLRLGMDVFDDGKLSERRQEQFIRTMKAYRQLMKVYGVKRYVACATSAMRDAKNGPETLKKIEKNAGLKLRIISGDEESRIIYENHLSLMATTGNYLYVDVGGGSTECTFMSNGNRLHSESYNVGTIRMLNGKVSPKTFNEMKEELADVTKGFDHITIIGSGGNINKLYRLANKRDRLTDTMPVETLRRLHDRLSKMSIEERMNIYKLKPDRADVIVPAAEIFLEIADTIKATEIEVPNLGLADGIISEMVEHWVAKKKEQEKE
jgi:exopolyphosphatase/guanosine-5'-triphosphate,3'-diphosphate pyrophosphatase